ncbi:hypothetical protein ACZ90_02355 [Streptomyces albus subsp. albus]|nr:hypothetical protein ADK33_29240 [Streptomyces griseus subsp. rhodochrous]KUJ70601.1 hypothetical protein ACZ90_02355 [Streptomyces albus subsp. albus]
MPPSDVAALELALCRLRDQLAVIAGARPTPQELIEGHTADSATARRIHQARPGVPVHHILAVLEVLRALDEMEAIPAPPEPPVVATARIQLDVAAAGTVPVPLEAFDRLVRVAMWVSRGEHMAHVPAPQISGSYPDAAARVALGALDDIWLLDTYPDNTEEAPDA